MGFDFDFDFDFDSSLRERTRATPHARPSTLPRPLQFRSRRATPPYATMRRMKTRLIGYLYLAAAMAGVGSTVI
ncbi:hypothetical protein, partial [Burkholderia cepacia]|uniref:hypothetical protein n=1 Tax=Burkholderia cepacia TaxID=292 RepID=UPI00066778E6